MRSSSWLIPFGLNRVRPEAWQRGGRHGTHCCVCYCPLCCMCCYFLCCCSLALLIVLFCRTLMKDFSVTGWGTLRKQLRSKNFLIFNDMLLHWCKTLLVLLYHSLLHTSIRHRPATLVTDADARARSGARSTQHCLSHVPCHKDAFHGREDTSHDATNWRLVNFSTACPYAASCKPKNIIVKITPAAVTEIRFMFSARHSPFGTCKHLAFIPPHAVGKGRGMREWGAKMFSKPETSEQKWDNGV